MWTLAARLVNAGDRCSCERAFLQFGARSLVAVQSGKTKEREDDDDDDNKSHDVDDAVHDQAPILGFVIQPSGTPSVPGPSGGVVRQPALA